MLSHGPGGYLSALALLTDTPYRRGTRAVGEALVFELDGDELRRLALANPSLVRAFLPAIESVSGTIKSVERDREAARRGRACGWARPRAQQPRRRRRADVATLRDYERMRQSAFAEVARAGAGAEQLAGLAMLGAEATDRTDPGDRLDPLARSDLEQELAETLEPQRRCRGRLRAHGGRPRRRMGRPRRRGAGRRGLAACASSPQAPARVLLAELEEATTRIADLVAAVQGYSYLDQAPRQAVDIHEGLGSPWSSSGTSCVRRASRSSATSTPSCRPSRRRARS